MEPAKKGCRRATMGSTDSPGRRHIRQAILDEGSIVTAQCAESTPSRRLRDALVEQHTPLARRIAARYSGRGEPFEDLAQVAMLGLVKAAERYDPDRGTDFPRYAVPTILGELRRHFRDSCWAVRVPRCLQELSLRAGDVADRLTGELGRSPTAAEIAERMDVSEDEVLEALEASAAYSTLSLDAPAVKNELAGPTVAERLSDDESPLDIIEAKQAVRSVVTQLPERERRMLTLRFFGERTQREIAEELSISQMHVSRLLTRTLTRLRAHLVEGVELPTEWQVGEDLEDHDGEATPVEH
jgi:RNA polymerase sigma-B factor